MKNNDLDKVLTYIGKFYAEEIAEDSRYYREIDIGESADRLGLTGISDRYRRTHALLLLKRPGVGMKVRIDGRTFKDYARFESGVVVPGHVARNTTLPREAFFARDSMVLVF